jgi:ribosomal protein S18 acetylase RimI-like enzyme
MSLIKDQVQAFRYIQCQQGRRVALRQTAQFLRAPFFEFHLGYALRKSLKGPIDVPAPQVAVAIRQAGLDDLALLETIVPPLRVRRFATKMQAGEVCCIAVAEERVVAYVFAGFGGTPSTEDLRLELGPGEAYLWAGYALPRYRRQGVVAAVNLSLCRLLQDRGCESVVLFVDGRNKAAIGHCKKMGYRVTDRITYLRILGWRLSRMVPAEQAGFR